MKASTEEFSFSAVRASLFREVCLGRVNFV